MNRPLKTALDVSVAGLRTANDIGLMPAGFGLLTAVVNAIIENCEQVKTHRHQCKALATKATELYHNLHAQAEKLKGTPLVDPVSEIMADLTSIKDKVATWAQYGFFRAFRNDAEIAAGLIESCNKLDSLLSKFNFTSLSYIASILGGPDGIGAKMDLLLEKMDHMSERERIRAAMMYVALFPNEALKKYSKEDIEGWEVKGHEELGRMRDEIQTSKTRKLTIENEPTDRIVATNLYLGVQKGVNKLQEFSGLPPAVKNLNGEVKKFGDIPYTGGTFSDVWQGRWLGDRPVAIKALRTVKNTSDSAVKRFTNELAIWRALKHPNVLNFLGIVTDIGTNLCLISPWQDNGNLLEFCKRNANADRLGLLIDAAKGIEYLHSLTIVHGNLKCSKILISNEERAVVSDFQMAKVLDNVGIAAAAVSVTVQASARWLAPEFSNSDDIKTSADIFSFSMTMLECFTLNKPYPETRREVQVVNYVSQGGRPARPTNNPWVTNSLWKLMEEGWNNNAQERPTMTEVHNRLKEIEESRK